MIKTNLDKWDMIILIKNYNVPGCLHKYLIDHGFGHKNGEISFEWNHDNLVKKEEVTLLKLFNLLKMAKNR